MKINQKAESRRHDPSGINKYVFIEIKGSFSEAKSLLIRGRVNRFESSNIIINGRDGERTVHEFEIVFIFSEDKYYSI